MSRNIYLNIKNKLNQKQILIIGFTYRTGLSIALLLEQLKLPYSIYDKNGTDNISDEAEAVNPKNFKCLKQVFKGEPSEHFLDNIDLIFLSPGVPRTNPLLIWAKSKNIDIWGDVDFIFPLLKDKVTIGVTGTDGKTTTVTLIEHLLSQDKNVLVCGNNGIPIFNVLDKIVKVDVIVLELSSYMLEENQNIFPTISIITNIGRDHLDRYPSFEVYKETKLKLFSGKDGTNIQNLDNHHLKYQGQNR